MHSRRDVFRMLLAVPAAAAGVKLAKKVWRKPEIVPIDHARMEALRDDYWAFIQELRDRGEITIIGTPWQHDDLAKRLFEGYPPRYWETKEWPRA